MNCNQPCDARKICTACGGTGWDPRAGPHPCPEAGIIPGPCAAAIGRERRKQRSSLIDAEVLQAVSGIRGAATAIQGTIFRDVKPFDPKKAVTDIVGS